MNTTLKILLLSIGKTALISAIVATIAFFTGKSWLLFFVIAFFVQFVLFYCLNSYLQYRGARDAAAFKLREAEILARNTMKVQCAACKKENDIVVNTSEENRFVCGHCKAKNSVYVYAESAIVTEPLYEPVPIPNTTSTNSNGR